jgi:hypothetical protein
MKKRVLYSVLILLISGVCFLAYTHWLENKADKENIRLFSKQMDAKLSSKIKLRDAVKFFEWYRADYGLLKWSFSVKPSEKNLKGVCLRVDYEGSWHKEYYFDSSYLYIMSPN